MNSFEVLTSSASNEWYTPPAIIEMARMTMGSIDLDPASNDHAQTWIRANRYYTEQTNGLNQSWSAQTVWLNPPYGNLGSKFCAKLLYEWQSQCFEQAIALVRGDSKAMEELFHHAYHCRSKRIEFIPSTELLTRKQEESRSKGRQWVNSPVPGTTIFYLGKNQQRFTEVFAGQGKIFAPAVKVGDAA